MGKVITMEDKPRSAVKKQLIDEASIKQRKSKMTLTETCLDKISRVAQNPNMWYFGKRLWRLWLKQLFSMGLYKIPDSPMLKNWDGKTSLYLQLQEGAFATRRLWFLGYVQYDEEYFLRSFLRPGMTVIDVGANIGYLSIICALSVRPSGAVHSFEPVSSTFEFLKKNIFTNGFEEIVTANRLAVSNRSGDIVKLDYCEGHSGKSHLSIDKSQKRKGWKLGLEQVTTISLDQYVVSHNIAKVDFLKIDVEGCELLVLAGAQEILKNHHPNVLCEFNYKALQRFGGSTNELWDKWKEYGYSFYNYNHRTRRLIRCSTIPKQGAPTYIGTTQVKKLAQHIGAKII